MSTFKTTDSKSIFINELKKIGYCDKCDTGYCSLHIVKECCTDFNHSVDDSNF